MLNKVLVQVCLNKDISLTPLRQDILEIIDSHQSSLTAYEILKQLKIKRPNAEPPTVYRVLDFFIQENLIHRIESNNAYILCSHLSQSDKLHLTILFVCKKCQRTFEYEDSNIVSNLKKLSVKNQLTIENSIIEMQGICKKCNAKKSKKA